MDFTPYIEKFRKRFTELEEQIAQPNFYSDPEEAQKILKEHSRLKQALDSGAQLQKVERQIRDNTELIEAQEDEELTELAKQELPGLEKQLEDSSNRLLSLILPPDPNASRDTIVEIRAGTGGDEAGIFAGDLFRMYSRFAERVGWKIEPLDSSASEAGGYKEITFMVKGEDVFKQLRLESGVHRVQRVPVTESQGRIHTSAATVAVLPEAKEIDLELKPEELRIEVCRAGGPGGQGVNTTDSAVQVMHIPTGLIVRCQDGRSQIKNREKAIGILRARLLEKKEEEERQKYADTRRKQIGSGDRNEKIRTYNYPQNRITDHRINFTLYNLTEFMDGNISELLEKLQASELQLRLSELEA